MGLTEIETGMSRNGMEQDGMESFKMEEDSFRGLIYGTRCR